MHLSGNVVPPFLTFLVFSLGLSPLLNITKTTKTNRRKASVLKTAVTRQTAILVKIFDVLNIK